VLPAVGVEKDDVIADAVRPLRELNGALWLAVLEHGLPEVCDRRRSLASNAATQVMDEARYVET
jgi:hypothetical protein